MQKWTDNDIYIINNLVEEDKALQNAWESYAETRMEDSAVSATQGKFLYMIAKICNAKRILELSLELSRAGTVIYGDNVVRNGELYNSISTDPKVNGVRVFIEELGRLKNVESTALQTVGIKGYDGFTMSIVR